MGRCTSSWRVLRRPHSKFKADEISMLKMKDAIPTPATALPMIPARSVRVAVSALSAS